VPSTFFGTYERTMDDKGRVVIPAELRTELGEAFMAYSADDRCVELMPKSRWQLLAQRVEDRDQFDEETKELDRIYFGGAYECSMDDAGRALIPPVPREAAKLGKEIVFVGARNRIELWNPEEWKRAKAARQAKRKG